MSFALSSARLSNVVSEQALIHHTAVLKLSCRPHDSNPNRWANNGLRSQFLQISTRVNGVLPPLAFELRSPSPDRMEACCTESSHCSRILNVGASNKHSRIHTLDVSSSVRVNPGRRISAKLFVRQEQYSVWTTSNVSIYAISATAGQAGIMA